MTRRRLFWYYVCLLVLPLPVAALQLPLWAAVVLVLAALLWRWLISLSTFVVPDPEPELELETIAASHFVEKVRWCLDLLGLDYRERKMAGALGAFFLGRTVPLLRFRSGLVRSSIGNSSEILRYLWGRYGTELGSAANFLQPTPERLDWERRIDRCGVDLQVWVYFHLLGDRELTLRAWGVSDRETPTYQRLSLRILYPLLRLLIRRSFRISGTRHDKARTHIEALLSDAEVCLADGRGSLLGGPEPDYADIAFASIMGLWLQPQGYGGGAAEAVRIDPARQPIAMRRDIETWRRAHPRTTAFIENLYQTRPQRAAEAGG